MHEKAFVKGTRDQALRVPLLRGEGLQVTRDEDCAAVGDPDMLRAEREADRLRGKTCAGCDWCLGADESGFMLNNVPDALRRCIDVKCGVCDVDIFGPALTMLDAKACTNFTERKD